MVQIIVTHEIEDGIDGATDSAPETFTLPRQLICSKSSYFKSLFEGGFQETYSGRTQLCDMRPWVFRVFVGWLYYQSIYCDGKRVEPTRFDRTRKIDRSRLDVPENDEGSNGGEEGKANIAIYNSKFPSLGCGNPSESNLHHARSMTSTPPAVTHASIHHSLRRTESEREDEQSSLARDECVFQDPVTWPYSWLFELYVFADKYPSREFRVGLLEIIQTKLTKKTHGRIPSHTHQTSSMSSTISFPQILSISSSLTFTPMWGWRVLRKARRSRLKPLLYSPHAFLDTAS